MNKNKEWLKKQMGLYKDGVGNCSFNEYTKGLNYAYETADDLINQLDEPEKVVIPQFVADWYEKTFAFNDGYSSIAIYQTVRIGWPGGEIEKAPKLVRNWVWNNAKVMLNALVNGYKIEEEKRYRLKLNAPILNDNDEVFLNVSKTQFDYFIRDEEDTRYDKTIFNESELELIDETGFERVEVVE